MSLKTTIQIKKETAQLLKAQQDHSRESYDEIIHKLLKSYEKTKAHNQYDDFLHKIQQMKMRELWDNEEDDAWNKY
ncbi:MAG: hypothetical protein E4G98_04020 [Promethearchaeota archaeon]|nr:MAG: hypothetical protein E4G98_04020 [Candidatus Lokiarchaeota archaeon]